MSPGSGQAGIRSSCDTSDMSQSISYRTRHLPIRAYSYMISSLVCGPLPFRLSREEFQLWGVNSNRKDPPILLKLANQQHVCNILYVLYSVVCAFLLSLCFNQSGVLQCDLLDFSGMKENLEAIALVHFSNGNAMPSSFPFRKHNPGG